MNSRTSQIVFGLTFLLIGVGLMAYSFTVKIGHSNAYGPMFFPRILLAGWILVSLLITINACLKGHLEKIEAIGWPRFSGAALIVFFFLFAFKYLGFIVSGILFFICYSAYLGYRKYFRLLLISSALIAVTWYVFYNILEIVLPEFWS